MSEVTEDNIQQLLEAGRIQYLQQLDKNVLHALSGIESSLNPLLSYMKEEIERGGKELAISRELFFLVGTGKLTQERWNSLVARKAALFPSREGAVSASNNSEGENVTQ